MKLNTRIIYLGLVSILETWIRFCVGQTTGWRQEIRSYRSLDGHMGDIDLDDSQMGGH